MVRRHILLHQMFSHIAAADFFTKEIWTVHSLQRFHILVVMDLITRRIKIAGIVPEPGGAWVTQVFRELTDFENGFLNGKKHLIVDRGSVFTDQAAGVLAAEGVRMKRLPPRSQNLNAHVERFNRSVQEEALDKILIFGEKHLRKVATEYAEHYHQERPHQGLGNKLIEPVSPKNTGQIVCKQRLGGLLKFYDRAA